jgi:hypothetical protein
LRSIPFERLEIIRDGAVVFDQASVGGREAWLEGEIELEEGGWMAVLTSGGAKTHAGYMAFAHTSPVYLRVAGRPYRKLEAIGALMHEIERSERAIRKNFRFTNDSERALALGRFEEAGAHWGD